MNRDLLKGYPEQLVDQVEKLYNSGKLAFYLESRYPDKHEIKSDKALYDYIRELKKSFMKKSPPVHKVLYDDSIETAYNALGLHSFVSRIQGRKLKSKSEIRISTVFRDAPSDFLEMIAVHELSHLKEKTHGREFYRLCHYMMAAYSETEFDFRLYLLNLERQKELHKTTESGSGKRE